MIRFFFFICETKVLQEASPCSPITCASFSLLIPFGIRYYEALLPKTTQEEHRAPSGFCRAWGGEGASPGVCVSGVLWGPRRSSSCRDLSRQIPAFLTRGGWPRHCNCEFNIFVNIPGNKSPDGTFNGDRTEMTPRAGLWCGAQGRAPRGGVCGGEPGDAIRLSGHGALFLGLPCLSPVLFLSFLFAEMLEGLVSLGPFLCLPLLFYLYMLIHPGEVLMCQWLPGQPGRPSTHPVWLLPGRSLWLPCPAGTSAPNSGESWKEDVLRKGGKEIGNDQKNLALLQLLTGTLVSLGPCLCMGSEKDCN